MRAILFAGAAVGAMLGAAGVWAATEELPPGPNRELVYGQCRTRHDLQYVVDSAGIPREEWEAVIDNMRQYGLRIPADQRDKIIEYLATYLGPHPPPKTTPTTAAAAPVDGAAVYAQQCAVCHQASGKGVTGAFPPLAGNRDLFLSRELPVEVVLHGISGAITVEATAYNGAMPSFAHLTDEQIAAVVRHVRSAWNNAALRPQGLAPVDAALVAAARKQSKTPQAVAAERQRLQ
jgi:mono/diheme cytochrome c family protein